MEHLDKKNSLKEARDMIEAAIESAQDAKKFLDSIDSNVENVDKSVEYTLNAANTHIFECSIALNECENEIDNILGMND